MTNTASPAAQVRAVLQLFQDGYTRRDPTQLDAVLALFAADDEVEIIGTGATDPAGDDEWCLGRAAVRRLIENDWQGWGDLRLDVAGARIHVRGDAAWLSTGATVHMTLPPDEVYQNFIDYLPGLIKKEGLSALDKVREIVRGSSNTLFEGLRGAEYTWPLRFTAVLVKEGGEWRFHQMQFSFPTTRFPDERHDGM